MAKDQNKEESDRHSFGKTDSVSIITPKSWWAHSLRTPDGSTWGYYHPALNQIWIDGSLPHVPRLFALRHEVAHSSIMMYFNSSLYAVRAELVGASHWPLPTREVFDDFVEPVCMIQCLLRPVIIDEEIPISVENLVGGTQRHRRICGMLIEMAESVAQSASAKSTHKQAIRAALYGLNQLYEYVMPLRPKLGPTVLQLVKDIPAPSQWESDRQIFEYYYAQLHRILEKSPSLTKKWYLSDASAHGHVRALIIFLGLASRMVFHRMEAVTAVFPRLLFLITYWQFLVGPVITVSNINDHYEAEIDLIHSTKAWRSQGMQNIRLQRKAFALSKRYGRLCSADYIALTIMKKALPFALSDQADRTFRCFEFMLSIIPGLFEPHVKTDHQCPGCAKIFSDSEFQFCWQAVKDMSANNKQVLLDAVGFYEKWLHTAAMEIIRETWDLQKSPRAIKAYCYL